VIDRELSNEGLTVEYLAGLCGISGVYLRKIFMTRFGVSPKEYIIQKRMDYACRLLLSGQLGVREVALHCGYSEPCHFSREFKKRIGVAPKNYL
jgi:AraC-like DNA-binding protein